MKYASERNLEGSNKSSRFLNSFLGGMFTRSEKSETGTYEMTELSTEQYINEHSKSNTDVKDIDEDSECEEKKDVEVLDIFEDPPPENRAPSPPLEIRPSSDLSLKPLGSSEPSSLSKNLDAPPGLDLASRKPADVILDRLAVALAKHEDVTDDGIDITNST